MTEDLFYKTRSGVILSMPSDEEKAADPVRELCRAGDLEELKRREPIWRNQPVDARLPWIASALSNGHTEIIRYFVGQGFDVNTSFGNSAWTPLHNVVSNRYPDLVKVLLDHGAQVNARDKYGHTPLMRAAGIGNVELAELLLQRGANVDLASRQGWTALHVASGEDAVGMIKYLVNAGADLEARTLSGATPLIQASMAGKASAVKTLLELGADWGAVDSSGKSSVTWARENRRTEVLSFLEGWPGKTFNR
jgi:ankyrin repeat protein